MQNNCRFLQNGKNRTSAGINKNQSKNEIYKTKSNKLFRAALLSVWLFVLMLTLSLILFPNAATKNEKISAVSGVESYLDIAIDFCVDKSELSGLTDFLSQTKITIIADINDANGSFKMEDAISENPTYVADYEFVGYTVYISVCIYISSNALYVSPIIQSADFKPIYNFLAGQNLNRKFVGIEIAYPSSDCTISNNIVTSNGKQVPLLYNAGNSHYGSGFIVKAKWGSATAQTTFESVVTGDNASAVFVYIMSADGVVTQFALVGNDSTVLTQNIGDTITILVSKPYMWSMSISGAGGIQNGTRYTYIVPSSASTITINLSGGSGITNNTLVV